MLRRVLGAFHHKIASVFCEGNNRETEINSVSTYEAPFSTDHLPYNARKIPHVPGCAWTEEEEAIHREISESLRLIGGKKDDEGVTPMKHIHQSETWDCGLACIQMILCWLQSEQMQLGNTASSESSDQEFLIWMKRFIGTESIWTIDLVFMLDYLLSRNRGEYPPRHRNVDPLTQPIHNQSFEATYVFCSSKVGIDKEYERLGYYKDAFHEDIIRVQQLFARAKQDKMPILEVPHLSLKVLVDFVSMNGCIAIVLTDKRLLHGKSGHSIIDGHHDSYAGHFIVLCGISHSRDDLNYARLEAHDDSSDDENFCMVIKDPGSWKKHEFVTAKRFEKAWRSHGTDEDVIFVNKHYS